MLGGQMDGKTIVLLVVVAAQVACRKNAVFEVGHTGSRYKQSGKQLGRRQAGGRTVERASSRADRSAEHPSWRPTKRAIDRPTEEPRCCLWFPVESAYPPRREKM